jgi:hypothetical protein
MQTVDESDNVEVLANQPEIGVLPYILIALYAHICYLWLIIAQDFEHVCTVLLR